MHQQNVRGTSTRTETMIRRTRDEGHVRLTITRSIVRAFGTDPDEVRVPEQESWKFGMRSLPITMEDVSGGGDFSFDDTRG